MRDSPPGRLDAIVDMLYLTCISKYQFMEANNQRRVGGLRDKIPDIQKTLETVRFLQKREVSCSHPIHAPVRLSPPGEQRDEKKLQPQGTLTDTHPP